MSHKISQGDSGIEKTLECLKSVNQYYESHQTAHSESVGDTGSSEHRAEFAAAVESLKFRVSTNVLLANVNVGDGSLATDLLESVLNLGSI